MSAQPGAAQPVGPPPPAAGGGCCTAGPTTGVGPAALLGLLLATALLYLVA